MQRQPSCCDFCGFLQVSHEYSTNCVGITWYACLECTRLIETEDWSRLIERGVAGCAQLRPMFGDEELVIQKQMEQLVENFRAVRLALV